MTYDRLCCGDTYYSCLENGTYSIYMISLIIMILLLKIVLELILNLDRYFHLVRRDIKSEVRLVIMTLVEGSRDWRNLAGLCSLDDVKLFMERLTGRRLVPDSGTEPKTHTGSVLVVTCTRSRAGEAGENTATNRCMCTERANMFQWSGAPQLFGTVYAAVISPAIAHIPSY